MMRRESTVRWLLGWFLLGGCARTIADESVSSSKTSTDVPVARTSAASRLSVHFKAADRIAAALASPNCVWVTDADGTLWSDDIGELFLQSLIQEGILTPPDSFSDIWSGYQQKLQVDKVEAYTFATSVMAGVREDQIQRRAAAFAHEFVAQHLYPSMRALIGEAQDQGCAVWIVSASNEWVVRAAAEELAIPPEHALGIRLAVRDGSLDSEVLPPINYAAGKVERIQEAMGRSPTIVSGDSAGDVDMLRLAERAGIFIQHDYTEPALLEKAKTFGWLVETFAMP